jgi:hypothetical protein
MTLTAEQIQGNWDTLISYITIYISEPRKTQLLKFYKKYEDRLALLPASHKKEYHSAFPGGYVYHVNRVIAGALDLYEIWERHGMDTSTFTLEELIFSALNHDLGKLGDENEDSYIPQTDAWRRDKLGEEWTFNTKIPFVSVPDRSLFFLQSNGIPYTLNEMIAIQTHDGLYDEGNKKYLMGWSAEQKPRTSLPFILHQADLMAARIEFELEWLPKLNAKDNLESNPKVGTLQNKPKSIPNSQKALKSIGSSGLSDGLSSMLNKIKNE